MFLKRKSLLAKLSVFGVMALVCLLALTHITIAVVDSGWGNDLPNVWGRVVLDSLNYDGVETESRHTAWFHNGENFTVAYNYEFKHQIVAENGAELVPNVESTHAPPSGTVSAGNSFSDTDHWRSIYVSNDTLVADRWYILKTYSRLEVWKNGPPATRDNWFVSDELNFQAD